MNQPLRPLIDLANFMARVSRWSARRFEKIAELRNDYIHLRPNRAPVGHAVLFYVTDPWRHPAAREKHYHTNRWECATMADTLLEAGYAVDVVDYRARHYRPPSDCAIAIDTEQSFSLFGAQLPAQCLKIFHAPTAHWLYGNECELRRLTAIQRRRNVALRPRRQLPPNPGIEVAAHGTYLGNKFTADTYAFAGKPLHRIPISTVTREDQFPLRDIAHIRRRFIWFGGVGLAHKGLDLALEAFARMPDLALTVAGAIHLDEDFVEAYRCELTATSNIRNIGWLDVLSPAFHQAMRDHLAIIYPSCAEGGAGSVICCMHSGVIPVVTYEASVDTLDFGFQTKGDAVEDIVEAVRGLTSLTDAQLLARSRATWEHVRQQHTRENFRRVWRQFARNTLKLSLRDD